MYKVIEYPKTYVYCIRSTAAPIRFYFGITVRPEIRMREHVQNAKRGSMTLLSKAIRKYGVDTFHMTVLREFDDRTSACKAEQEIISAYGGVKRSKVLWNGTSGGDTGYEYGDDARARMLENMRKAVRTEERRAARSIISKEIWARPGAKQARSEKLKAICQDNDYLRRRGKSLSHTFKTAQSKLKRLKFYAGVSVDDPSDIIAVLAGNDAKECGLDPRMIQKCASEKYVSYKTYKGRTWIQITHEEGLAMRSDLQQQLKDEGVAQWL